MICSTSLKVLLPTTYVPLPTQLLTTPLMVLVLMLAVNCARAESPQKNPTPTNAMPTKYRLIAMPSLTPKYELLRPATCPSSEAKYALEVETNLQPPPCARVRPGNAGNRNAATTASAIDVRSK